MNYENINKKMHEIVIEFIKLNLSQIEQYIEVDETYYKISIKELNKGAVNRLKLGGFIQDE